MDITLLLNRITQLKEAKVETENELYKIEKKQADLKHTLSRISGAIDVLEEFLKEQEPQ